MPAQARCASCTQPRTEPQYTSALRHSGLLTYLFGICNPPFPPLMPMTVATYLAKDMLIVNSVLHVRTSAWSWEGAYRTRCAGVNASSRSPRLIGILALPNSERSAFSPIGSTHMTYATARWCHTLCAIDPLRCSGEGKQLCPHVR